jgi:phosphate transport system permease protein
MNKFVVDSQWHKKRQRAEKRFQLYGKVALGFAVVILLILLGSIFTRGISGFLRTEIKLSVQLDLGTLPAKNSKEIEALSGTAFMPVIQEALRSAYPDVAERKERRKLYDLMSDGAGIALKNILITYPHMLSGKHEVWLPASSVVDLFVKHGVSKLDEEQKSWLAKLQEQGAVRKTFNTTFFSNGDSRAAEQAGFLGAMAGSFFTLIICLLAAFPVGVMAAIYLEEFARKGKWVDIIEVNINNLAAVPSIVFGLLGLAIYINVMGLPRSAPLVGGLTLALMVLPVIIIATRSALKSVPPSIRDAARALGATPIQVVWHHTLPLAMPGVMTGTILGMARAIGETAPLLMIGMVAFIVDIPDGFTTPATVMPVQIYLWASSPEAGFAEKTAAGILVLLVLLLAMNAFAIFLRKRFEIRW